MKNFCIVLFTLLLLNAINVKAQEKPASLLKGESATVANNLIKVETLYPNLLGLSYEKKITPNISVYNMLGLLVYGGGGVTAQTVYGVNPYYVAIPQISVQPRFYHNINKRAALEKNITYNSANYIGLTARLYDERIFFSNSDNIAGGSAVFDLMLSYGLQRTFFKRLNWDMSFQPGIEFYDGEASFFIGLNLQLGFVIFSN